jgi:hypothetical protein
MEHAMVRAARAAIAAIVVVSLAACGIDRGTTSAPQADAAISAPVPSPAGSASSASAMPISTKILFLHHSTGEVIWKGGVPAWFTSYNAQHGTSYQITEQAFPKNKPYGWNNYPYDYWNIWVRHAGSTAYQSEPTLEMLAAQYDVIVWKHCFPVSNVLPDNGRPNVASSDKRLENYKLQYEALKQKMRSFPNTRFVVWTSSALIKSASNEAEADRSRAFVDWVRGTWDERGDNIYVWDFWQLETEGGRYLAPGNAGGGDSHPNATFANRVAPMFTQRVVDAIEGRGDL